MPKQSLLYSCPGPDRFHLHNDNDDDGDDDNNNNSDDNVGFEALLFSQKTNSSKYDQ